MTGGERYCYFIATSGVRAMRALRRLSIDDITPGMPLPCPVFDRDGNELFAAGIVIASIGYTRLLLARGLYRYDDGGGNPAGVSGAAGGR